VVTELLVQADRLVGGGDAVLVVDDTAIPKKGPRTLAATIKARWVCEQAHQQLKEELGLDHFEGRSWQGLHRHALMTMIAYAFLQYRRLATARRKKRINGPPPQPTLPAVRHAILALLARPPPQRCPDCRKWICSERRHE
jgi:SRSO17 transposase